jgi:SEL1 protein
LALEEYLRLAEMGYEVAEVNAAKVMDMLSASSSISLVPTSTKDDLLRSLHSFFNLVGLSRLPLNSSQEAFLLYQRAAEQQGNFKARVRVGDFYFYGQFGSVDLQEAASHYRIASEGKDARAQFTLGLQHHYGLGLTKDLHLAKRYYELAFESASESKLAVYVQLTFLWLEKAKVYWTGDFFASEEVEAELFVAGDAVRVDWMWSRSVSIDTVLMLVLVVLFLVVGMVKDHRRVVQQRRAGAGGV